MSGRPSLPPLRSRPFTNWTESGVPEPDWRDVPLGLGVGFSLLLWLTSSAGLLDAVLRRGDALTGVLLLPFAGFVAWMLVQARAAAQARTRLREAGILASAEVIGSSPISQSVEYGYVVDGMTFTGSLDRRRRYREGERIEIVYDPADPQLSGWPDGDGQVAVSG